MSENSLVLVWKVIDRAERRRALLLLGILLLGTLFEIVSFGALIPAITVLVGSEDGGQWAFIARFMNEKSDLRLAAELMGFLSLLYALKSAYLVLSIWYQRGFARRIELRLATSLVRTYLAKPYEFHLSNHSSVLVRNIGATGQFVVLNIDSLLVLGTDGTLLGAILIFLIFIEPVGTLVALIAMGLLGVVYHSVTKGKIESWGFRRTHLEAKRLQYLQEGFGAIKELKVLETEHYFAARVEADISESTSLARKFTTLNSLPRIWLELFAFVGLAFLILVLTARGKSILDSLPVLTVFAAAAFRVMPTLNRIIFAVQNLKYGRAATEILAMEQENLFDANSHSSGKIRSIEHRIELEDVVYRYQGTSIPVIDRARLTIRAGSITGIVGESGSGKSTLANLLLGLLTPTSGKVCIDDLEIGKSGGSVSGLIGYVPQSVFLIDDTILKNIAFGVPENEIDTARMDKAIRQSSLAQLVQNLPNGLGTHVGEAGVKLSGGQRQRVGIARALYFDPPILLLDEATSSLDSATELKIIEELRSMKNSRTVILITHRESTLSICDDIYRMAGGKLHKVSESSASDPPLHPSRGGQKS